MNFHIDADGNTSQLIIYLLIFIPDGKNFYCYFFFVQRGNICWVDIYRYI